MGGNVPEGWREVQLHEVATLNPDSWDPRECETIQYLDLAAVIAPGRLAPPVRVTASRAPSRARRKARAGDILASTVRPYLRGFARLHDAPEDLVVSTGFTVLRAAAGTDGGFLYQHVLSSGFVRHLEPRMTGSGYPAVRSDDIGAYEVLLPPLPEQRAIAAVLDAVDETIEQTEAVIGATEELRKALLHDLLTRGVPGWHTEWKQVPGLGTVPACWEVVQLGEVGKWMSGGTPSKERADYWTGPIPWISAKDMKVREISDAVDHISEEAAVRGSRTAPPGSIFVVVRGMILAHTFPIAISRVPCAFNQDLRALVCAGGVEPDYVIAAMENRRSRLLDLPTTATHGTLRVITDELQAIEIPLAPPREQREIADATSGADRHLAALSRSLTPLRDAKTALAEALLSGRVRVKPTAEVMA